MKDTSRLVRLLGMVPEQAYNDPWVDGDPIRFEISTDSKEDDAIAKHIASSLSKNDLMVIQAIIGDDHMRWADLGQRIYFAIQKAFADATSAHSRWALLWSRDAWSSLNAAGPAR